MKAKYLLIVILLLAALLRFPKLDKYPPALYSDEVSQGYNAYSVLKTGKDEYGTYFPVSFRSFGDWKPPLPTYLMIPTIALFGLNAWGVRLPSAILGTITVWILYELIWELSRQQRLNIHFQTTQKIALLAALFITISPWHILQSRSAMLVCIALFWLLLAIWSFLKGLQKTNYWWIVSGVGFVAAIYSYYGMRLIVPLILLGLMTSFGKEIWQKRGAILAPSILVLILLLPLLISFLREPSVIFGRVKTVSIFYDDGVRLKIADLIAKDGRGANPYLVRIFHNKPFLYTTEIIRRIGEHLDGTFLFLKGDSYSPFQLPQMGILYLTDTLFISWGVVFLLRRQKKIMTYCLTWWGLSILPAALTFVTPSSNRIFNSLAVLIFFSAVGVTCLVKKFKHYFVKLVISVMIALQMGYFMQQYFLVLPKDHAQWWHWGNLELFSYLNTIEKNYEVINIYGEPTVIYIFKLFYQRVDPNQIQTQIRRNFQTDEYGFEHVDAYGKYQFLRKFDWQKDGDRLFPGSILAVPARVVTIGEGAHLLYQITYPNGQPAYNIYEI